MPSSTARPGTEVGSVSSVWRYPVKSMAGESLPASEITARGLLGDRAYALVDDADQKVASAKNPRKWPTLFAFSAALAAPPTSGPLPAAVITLPDGSRVSTDDGAVDATLSRAVNRTVRVRSADSSTGAGHEPWTARAEEYRLGESGLDLRDTVTEFEMPPGTFFDAAVLHIVTTATLDRLTELYPAGVMAPRRFRPNLVIDTPDTTSGFVEAEWVGRTLQIGDDVRLAVTKPCGRCVMVTLPQAELPKDAGILRTAAQHNHNHVGVYAAVLSGGLVRRGDAVMIEWRASTI